jgi:hypothetical protein
MKTAFLVAFTLVIAALPSCNLLEGLNQTNPSYTRPVLFSDAWFARRAEAKAKAKRDALPQ